MQTKCPHCGGEINPARMLAKLSVKARDTSSEAMKKLSMMRTKKQKELKQ